MKFHLKLRQAGAIPLELDGIIPERLVNLSAAEVARLEILVGNRKEPLGEHFDVQEHSLSAADLVISGDCSRVKSIGARMTTGLLVVEESAGMHTGARMTGGTLRIEGDAAEWLGAEMTGGEIKVRGSAGDQAGAGYRGCRKGMSGGLIHIHKNAGAELGLLMRRGMIIVGGKTGAFAGASMIAGSLILLGDVGENPGAGMKRGTLWIRGQAVPTPGFRFSCEYLPSVLPLLAAALEKRGLHQLKPYQPVRCYRGDQMTGGRGELWLTQPEN